MKKLLLKFLYKLNAFFVTRLLLPVPRWLIYQYRKVVCPDCGKVLPLDETIGLEMHPCPRCGENIFYPLRIDDYLLYTPLGAGGGGSVYKAIRGWKRWMPFSSYAVKIVPKSQLKDQVQVEELLREGEIGKILGRHKHLVPVVEYGQDYPYTFMVTKYYNFERLDLLISRVGKLHEKIAVDIILQILKTDTYIRNCGFLYRDLKPENIIIGNNGKVLLFDYGLCEPIDEDGLYCNLASAIQGSPFYLPPERVMGAHEGEFSEIYSLGMILFLMLKGRTYFSDSRVKQLIMKHVDSVRFTSVKESLKNCHPKMVIVLDKMISRNPNDRYHDFKSLKHDLKVVKRNVKSEILFSFRDFAHPEKKKKRIILLIILALFLSLFGLVCLSILKDVPFNEMIMNYINKLGT